MEENEIPKHRKKKPSSVSKSFTKSKHKHKYQPGLLICEGRPHWASVCSVCGKVGDVHFFETERTETGTYRGLNDNEVYEKYKGLERFEVENVWQKYVTVRSQ